MDPGAVLPGATSCVNIIIHLGRASAAALSARALAKAVVPAFPADIIVFLFNMNVLPGTTSA
jgi:hypothetical protein